MANSFTTGLIPTGDYCDELVTVTTEDFETVAVRIPATEAACIIGRDVRATHYDLARNGIVCHGRFIVETAPHESKRDGWIHPDFASPYYA